jgi:zinc protease
MVWFSVRTVALFCSILVCAPSLRAEPQPAATTTTTTGAPRPAVPEIPWTRFVLDNGLDVIVVEDHRIPLVAVDLWVHVGSGDEKPGRSGFAHLFEHMMFQGAEHIGEDVHFDILRQLGATRVNGTTNSDRTNFYEVVPSQHLETALWLESDRLGFLLPLLSEKSLANQRDVVRNERRQRYEDVPYGRERFATQAALYPEGHPYRYLTIGRHEDIEKASVDDVRGFYAQWYTPSNATLALVGDVTVDTAKALTSKWFAGLRGRPRPAATTWAPVTLSREVRVAVDDPFARLSRVRFAWHGPKMLADDDIDLSLLADILGAPGWGRLYRALVIDHPYATSVSVQQDGHALGGTFQIAVTLKADAAVAEVERLLGEELAHVLSGGPSDVELARSTLNSEAGLLWSLEDLLNRAERLQFFRHTTGDPGYTRTYIERLRSRTARTVTEAARRWLGRPKAIVVTLPAPTTTTTTTTPTTTPTTTTTTTTAKTGGVR